MDKWALGKKLIAWLRALLARTTSHFSIFFILHFSLFFPLIFSPHGVLMFIIAVIIWYCSRNHKTGGCIIPGIPFFSICIRLEACCWFSQVPWQFFCRSQPRLFPEFAVSFRLLLPNNATGLSGSVAPAVMADLRRRVHFHGGHSDSQAKAFAYCVAQETDSGK